MRAFGIAVLFTLVVAATAGFVMRDLLSVPADEAFATTGARVGEEPSVQHRNLSGETRN